VLISLLFGSLPWDFKIMVVLAFVLAIMIALVLHEIAHGYAALKCGDPSAKIAGRLSLNPARHIEPMGLLCFCIAGIGWAKPVPVNPFNYRNFRRGNFWVSIAGVLVNLVLGFVFSLFMFLMYKYVGMDKINGNLGLYFVYYFFLMTTAINITLMIFNLLPVYPLDGFNMLVSFTKPDNRFMEFSRKYSMFILMGVLVVLIVTGALAIARDGIVDGFLWFWGLMF